MVHRPRSLQPGRIRPGRHAGQPRLRRGTCRLLGLCLVAGLAGPATPAGPDPPAPGRPAPAGHAWLTATRADAGTAAGAARQAIRFRQPDGTSAGAADTSVGTPVTLQATASSGLPVSFRSATPLVCTVSGTIVTTVAAGVCTITASQAGNTEFAAAPDRARAFQIGTGQQPAGGLLPPAGRHPARAAPDQGRRARPPDRFGDAGHLAQREITGSGAGARAGDLIPVRHPGRVHRLRHRRPARRRPGHHDRRGHRRQRRRLHDHRHPAR